jgi:hypothetical protein
MDLNAELNIVGRGNNPATLDNFRQMLYKRKKQDGRCQMAKVTYRSATSYFALHPAAVNASVK